MRRPRTIFLALLLVGVLAASVYWRAQAQAEHRRRVLAYRDGFKTYMVTALNVYYRLEGELPPDWDRFDASGTLVYTPDIINAIWELELNGPGDVHPGTALSQELFPVAVAEAQSQEGAWKTELAAARQPWLDRAGDLRGQLSLLLDADFDGLVVIQFLKTIRDDAGVPEAKLRELVDAHGRLAEAAHLIASPESAIDHPDFIPITRARAEAQLAESTAAARTLIDEIVAMAESNAAGMPTQHIE